MLRYGMFVLVCLAGCFESPALAPMVGSSGGEREATWSAPEPPGISGAADTSGVSDDAPDGCDNACPREGLAYCQDDEVFACAAQAGCLSWQSVAACQQGCDSAGIGCAGCAHACTAGQMRCADGERSICTSNDQGCLQWAAPEPCASDVCADAVACADATCIEGATQLCGTNVGACERGMQTCEDGSWGACVGEVAPTEEVCEGSVDEDCDGDVDEDCVLDRCARADVVFLLDTTGSMAVPLHQLRTEFLEPGGVVDRLSAQIGELRVGLVAYQDFGMLPYGGPIDVPAQILSAMTTDFTSVQLALNALTSTGGGDIPESAVEALHHLVTGSGAGAWLMAADPDACTDDAYGAVCLSPTATPIVVVITDAPTHNGPPIDRNPYEGGVATVAHTYEETTAALTDAGVFVVGLAYNAEPTVWLDSIARDTNAVTVSGAAIVEEINDDNLVTGLGDAIVALCAAG